MLQYRAATGLAGYPRATYQMLGLARGDSRFALLAVTTSVKASGSVRGVAEALSRASGVTIRVDKSVPEDLNLSIDATGVPLAAILENIASQTDLQIAPVAPKGVELRSWPHLSVNGQVADTYHGAHPPWSDEWQISNGYTARSAYDKAANNLFGSPQPNSVPVLSDLPIIGNLFRFPGRSDRGLLMGGSAGNFTIAPLNANTIVVGEPGFENGQYGLLLTVYEWDAKTQSLRKVRTMFHAPTPVPPKATGRGARTGAGPVNALPRGPYTEVPGTGFPDGGTAEGGAINKGRKLPEHEEADIEADNADIRNVLKLLFQQYGVSYTVNQGVRSVPITVHIKAPLRLALENILKASSQPLTYRLESGIYTILPQKEEEEAPAKAGDAAPESKP